MEIQKREELIELYDLYYELLTDKQKDYFEEYYFMDLSITEIALNHEISRNGVFDQLKRACNILYEYESKLKLHQKIKEIKKLNLDEEALSKVLNIFEGTDE
jgi:predicted DNA-binding protein YlxM (UPF0122 family)